MPLSTSLSLSLPEHFASCSFLCSLSASVYLFAHLSISFLFCLFVSLSHNLSLTGFLFGHSIFISVSLSPFISLSPSSPIVCLSVSLCLSLCLSSSFSRSLSIFVSPPLYLTPYLSFSPSFVHPSDGLSASVSMYLPDCLSLKSILLSSSPTFYFTLNLSLSISLYLSLSLSFSLSLTLSHFIFSPIAA